MVAFKELDNIEPGAEIDSLKKKHLWDVQRALAFLSYPVRTIDGQIGPRTRNAWAEFKEDIGEGNPTVLSASSIEALKEKTAAIDTLLGASSANPEQVKSAIAALCKAMEIGLKPQIAYVLATTQWETAHTFKPVKEAFWLSETWRKNNLHYYPYYGRGYVQLTWKNNYEQYSNILDQDMVGNPDLALQPNVSLFVLVHGFKTGTFTGRMITEFINAGGVDYKNARKCINGLDAWKDIQKLAEHYFDEL
jgi:hypothetical protein